MYEYVCFLFVLILQEDINVTSEAGRQHIFGQSLHDKRELIRGWILRDHRPLGVRGEK